MFEIDDIKYKGPCIYCILNLSDGKMYFGQTVTYSIRSKGHYRDLKANEHCNPLLQRAYNKGRDFIMIPVEFCEKEKLNDREKFWIAFHKTDDKNYGYNLTTGGDSLFKRSPEAVKRMVDTRRGKSGSLKGRKQTEEHIKNRFENIRGTTRQYSDEHLKAIKNAREKMRGTEPKGRSVLVFDRYSGRLYTFDSLAKAERKLNIPYNQLSDLFFKKAKRKKMIGKTVNKILHKNYFIEKPCSTTA